MSKRKGKKSFNVLVTTPDASLQFAIDAKTTGQQLFDLVIKTTGLREVWFFDLRFTNSQMRKLWLKRHRKVLSQDVPHVDPIPLEFAVKYFPEEVGYELIEPITQNMFFLTIQKQILDEELWCKAEHCVVLASLALQAKFGDFDADLCAKGFTQEMQLLPQRILNQYQMTPEMWEERIVECYKRNKNLFPEEAMVKYLTLAQDLEMYGVSYYAIKNKKGTVLWLGVDALGLNIYKSNDKLTPSISFPWSEIKTVEYNDKKFVIKSVDKQALDLVFFSVDPEINKNILQLCIGNHELYLKRRGADSMEVQQMRAEAEERLARMNKDRERLLKEVQQRKRAEREKEKMAIKLKRTERKMQLTQQSLSKAETTAELLSQQVERAESESGSLLRRSEEAKDLLQQLLHEKRQNEEEKKMLEEQMVRAMSQAREQQSLTDRLRQELSHARQSELEARLELERQSRSTSVLDGGFDDGSSVYSDDPLADCGSPASSTHDGRVSWDPMPPRLPRANSSSTSATVGNATTATTATTGVSGPDPSVNEQHQPQQPAHRNIPIPPSDRFISQSVQQVCDDLSSLKIEGQMTNEDRIKAENEAKGETKHDTLTRISTGSAKSRISFFEQL